MVLLQTGYAVNCNTHKSMEIVVFMGIASISRQSIFRCNTHKSAKNEDLWVLNHSAGLKTGALIPIKSEKLKFYGYQFLLNKLKLNQ